MEVQMKPCTATYMGHFVECAQIGPKEFHLEIPLQGHAIPPYKPGAENFIPAVNFTINGQTPFNVQIIELVDNRFMRVAAYFK
jgi:hypothetical protein